MGKEPSAVLDSGQRLLDTLIPTITVYKRQRNIPMFFSQRPHSQRKVAVPAIWPFGANRRQWTGGGRECAARRHGSVPFRDRVGPCLFSRDLLRCRRATQERGDLVARRPDCRTCGRRIGRRGQFHRFLGSCSGGLGHASLLGTMPHTRFRPLPPATPSSHRLRNLLFSRSLAVLPAEFVASDVPHRDLNQSTLFYWAENHH